MGPVLFLLFYNSLIDIAGSFQKNTLYITEVMSLRDDLLLLLTDFDFECTNLVSPKLVRPTYTNNMKTILSSSTPNTSMINYYPLIINRVKNLLVTCLENMYDVI